MLTSFVETTTGRRKGFVESPVFARNGSLALPTLKYLEVSTNYEPSWFSNVVPGGYIGPDDSTYSETVIAIGRTYQRRQCTRAVGGGSFVRDETHTFVRDELGRSKISHPATTVDSLYSHRSLEGGGYEQSFVAWTDTWGAVRNAGTWLPGLGGWKDMGDGWFAPPESSRVGAVYTDYGYLLQKSGTWGNMTVSGDYYFEGSSELWPFTYTVSNIEEDNYDALYQEQIDYLDTLNSVSPDDWGTLSVPIDAAGGNRIDVYPVMSGNAGPGFVYGGWTQSAWGRNHKRYWVYNQKNIRLDYVKVTAHYVFGSIESPPGMTQQEMYDEAAGMAVIRCEAGVSNPGDVVRSPDWTGTVIPQALTDWVVAMPGFAAVMFGVTPEQAAKYFLDRVPSTVRGVYRVEIV